MTPSSKALLAAVLLPLAALAAPKDARPQRPPSAPPVTPLEEVVDTYHGVQVKDPYQWLERSEEPRVRQWVRAQNTYSRSLLDRLAGRGAIRQRITELLTFDSASWFGLREHGRILFALKVQPPRPQPVLVMLTSADAIAGERVLFNPARYDRTGRTTIDFFVPSRDGKRVAISLSQRGTESGDVHVFDVATGQELSGEVVPRVNTGTAGGSLVWNRDGTGFFYTRHPRGEERPAADRDFYQQIYFHKLGTPTEQDTYELGRDFPRIAITSLHASEDGQWLLARVAHGDGGEFALYLRSPEGKWTQVSRFEDKLVAARFGPDRALYALSLQGAPRGKLLRLPLESPSLAKATQLVPEGEATLQGLLPTANRLYLVEQLGGPLRLRVVDLQGKPLGLVPTLPVSSVGGLLRQGQDDVLFSNSSHVHPPAWYRYSAKSGKVTRTALVAQAPFDPSDTEVVRTEAVSKDGTRVPLTILKLRGVKQNGTNPTLLTGYGGFAISRSPGFSALARVWLEQGGVLAIANLRGGAEFGEPWHQAGMLERKQNVFDDFYACARLLVEQKYTRPQRLAIEGGSNGGLLMGAALTQHPEMYAAVVAHVGIFDMLRVELTPNGQFNITEYGTVKDPEQFRAMYAYSPYHRVKSRVKYPAVLLTAGENDPRVDPFHSRKMAARLQAATSSDQPVLLRTNAETGHGSGTPLAERIEEQVDVHAFLFNELGVKYRPVPKRGKVPAPKAR